MVADLFVMLFLITMVLFIVYHFYIDYKNWSNTGNTFAEGYAERDPARTEVVIKNFFPANMTAGKCCGSSSSRTRACQPPLSVPPNQVPLSVEKEIPKDSQKPYKLQYEYKIQDQGWGNFTYGRLVLKNITTGKNHQLVENKARSKRIRMAQDTAVAKGTADISDYVKAGDKVKLQFTESRCNSGHSLKFIYYKDMNLTFHKKLVNPTQSEVEKDRGLQRNFAQIMEVNRQVQEQQIRNARNSGINLMLAAGIDPKTKIPWKIRPSMIAMPKNIAEYVIGEIISGRLDPPPPGSPWTRLLRGAAPQAYQRIGSANPLQQQAGAGNSQAKWNQMGNAMLMMLRSKIKSGEMPPPPQGSDWENQLRTIGPIPPLAPHPSGRPAPTPQQVMMVYGIFTTQVAKDLGEKIKRREIPPPPFGSFWDNKIKASGVVVNTEQTQQFNQQFDKQMAIGQFQSQNIKQGQTLQGIPSSQPAASKMQNTAIFNEQLMKQVLSNKLLIPSDIKLSQENQGNFIRVGKNFMKDLSHIRNVAIPNIDNDDYESLGRVVAKIKIQEKEKITGPQNIVAKQKLMNSVNNILAGSTISNSQVDWESPQHSTTLRTTGMYGDNSNSMIGGGDKASKPEGGLCMWKGCEKHPKRKPYDSVWSLY